MDRVEPISFVLFRHTSFLHKDKDIEVVLIARRDQEHAKHKRKGGREKKKKKKRFFLGVGRQ